ncbi:uncharacterized protein LOC134777606 [Penaeus indicus]|uniref:uncharacterized protein LOC134777606 n=1 Tax=Penaeus indicus TaxID=29960 RepID=UPI00300D8F88
MSTFNIVDIVKTAQDAGISPADINNLVARSVVNAGQSAYPDLKLPNFCESKDDIHDYLARFEKIAEIQNWEVERYHIYLGAQLTGKALKTYINLPNNVLSNYELVKDALLKTYCLDAESYRKKFRESKVNETESYVQLVTRMEQYLRNWISLSEVREDFNDLCDFLVRDQLLSNCSLDLRIFLKERLFDNTLDMAQAADRFRAAHRNIKPRKTFSAREETSERRDAKSDVVCHNCKATGHIRPNCPELKRSRLGSSKVNFVFESDLTPQNSVTDDAILFNKPVNALFDSGCSTIIVKDSLIPPYVKRRKTITLYDYLGVGKTFPEIRCFIKSRFLTGWVNAVAAPIKFTDILIGMVPGVKMPALDLTGKTNNGKTSAIDKHEIASADNLVMEIQTRRGKMADLAKPRALNVPELIIKDITKQELMEEQGKCVTLNDIRSKVERGSIVNVKHRTVKYEKVNDLIYRICLQSKNENEIGMKQLVVPRKFRHIILSTAHDSPVAGHFSHRKTSEKIFYKFFWPGAGADIKRFCRSCPTCQRSSPKGKVKKVPLVSMPVINEPFSRVAIDLVGPLSPSERGHRYILTLIDCATRFPEAVPLRSIDTVTVAENLIDIFSRVGIPKEILSDRGTQFKSDLMNEINRLLCVKALYTSPYHACCNGTVERFHAVLKSMVRGPLTILYELWTNDNLDGNVKNTYQYVLDLRTKLEESAQLASSHAKINSNLYKAYFDRGAKARSLAVGDEVLVLLPSTHNKLTMQWKGPYTVIKRHDNGVDYLIKVKGKAKLYHINMMKKFIKREDIETPNVCQICVVDDDIVSDDTCDVSVMSNTVTNFNIGADLKPDQIKGLRNLLDKYPDVFSDNPGLTSSVTHDIKLTTTEPVHRKPYAIPHHLIKPFEAEVQRMKELGVIEPSDSPYCSPVVLVKKSNNTWRFCVDFRALNNISQFDAEPMPFMDEALGNFTSDKFFTELDLCKGYWQIPLSERSKPYTAFATKYGLMQFARLPFGLKTACATFVRLMRKVIKGLNNTDCYFDNIVVHNAKWEDHLIDLTNLLNRLRLHGLTAGPDKCFFGYTKIKYLGFTLGDNCLRPVDAKIKAIIDMPLPKTKKQLRSFLGTVSFYRKFIPNFADIVSPINVLLRKYSSNVLILNDEQIARINLLKDKLINAPILTLPDYNKQFFLRTDASDTGLGAILLQEMNGELMPVAYASRALLDRETRYAVIERECLAIVWGIEKFKSYLYGKEFILQTDQQPLTYLLNMKNSNGRLMRWSLALQAYSFIIQYIKGVDNVGADLLSRCPVIID